MGTSVIARRTTGVLSSFVEFLDKSNLVSSAAAFILGISANSFFRTLVNETVVKAVNERYDLSGTVLRYGNVEIKYGAIIVQLINLIAVSFTVFLVISFAQTSLGWT